MTHNNQSLIVFLFLKLPPPPCAVLLVLPRYLDPHEPLLLFPQSINPLGWCQPTGWVSSVCSVLAVMSDAMLAYNSLKSLLKHDNSSMVGSRAKVFLIISTKAASSEAPGVSKSCHSVQPFISKCFQNCFRHPDLFCLCLKTALLSP